MNNSRRDVLDNSQPLSLKNVVVIGGSLGVGREIVAEVHTAGAKVLAVARGAEGLEKLRRDFPGVEILVGDATRSETVSSVFDHFEPDVLVIAAGAIPPMRSFCEQTWEEFSTNWEVDLKASFLFCKAVLDARLPTAVTVVLISSGAAIGGSPLSGSYAGAKRMQMFLAEYAQEEAERRSLKIRFFALAPGGIMPQTRLGEVASAGYSAYLAISREALAENFEGGPAPKDVARAVLDVVTKGETEAGSYVVKAAGMMKLD